MPGAFPANQNNFIDAGRVNQPGDEFQSLLKKHPQWHQDPVVQPHRLPSTMLEAPQAEFQ
jgi:hypothetical protein